MQLVVLLDGRLGDLGVVGADLRQELAVRLELRRRNGLLAAQELLRARLDVESLRGTGDKVAAGAGHDLAHFEVRSKQAQRSNEEEK